MSEVPFIPCSPVAPTDGTGRPPWFDPRWRTETVVALSRGIDADSAYDRLPILADALEEAGCDLPLLLHHCRHCPTHAPGCWAVELVLDRVPPPPLPQYPGVASAVLRDSLDVRLSQPVYEGNHGSRRPALIMFGLILAFGTMFRVLLGLGGLNPSPTYPTFQRFHSTYPTGWDTYDRLAPATPSRP